MSEIHRRGKTWLPVLAVGLGLATLSALTTFGARVDAAPGANQAAAQGPKTVVVEIPEVSCASCSLQARRAVKSAGGVTGLEKGEAKNRLVIKYAPGPGRPEVYVEALRKSGFGGARRVAAR